LLVEIIQNKKARQNDLANNLEAIKQIVNVARRQSSLPLVAVKPLASAMGI